MKRVFLVARHEFTGNIKRRGFLFMSFGLPLLIIAAQFGVAWFAEQQSQATGTLGQIGYVDLTPDGILGPAVDKPDEFRAFPDPQTARSALVAQEIGAYFVVPADYVAQGIIHAYGIQDVPRSIDGQMSSFLTDNLLADWPLERAIRLKDPSNLTVATLDGEKEIVGDESVLMAILLPMTFAVLLIMSVIATSGFLLQGVVEEKENRVMEILMTSITPLQMLWGKILGLEALGLVQIAVWAAAGRLALSQGSTIWSSLGNISIPAPLLVWGPVFLLLGYLLYGALLAGIGASVTSTQEGQQISGVVSLVAAIPLFLSMTFIENANGPLPIALSLVPFTAPVAMVMRLPIADVPLWQVGLSAFIMASTTLLVVWIAARVFHVGLLMYGKRLGLRPLWIVLRRRLDTIPDNGQE